MKFTSVVTLFAAISGTYALVMEKRMTPVRQVIVELAEGVGDLHEAARTFSADIEPVVRVSDHVIEIIQGGQRIADTCDPLTLSDSYSLVNPTKLLQKKTRMLFKMIKQRVDDIRRARVCGTTRDKMTTIMALSTKLMDTIINKQESPMARSVAKNMSTDIKVRFQAVENMLSEGNCPI
ncbi:hypothetical protein E4U54_008122 [Claviceps lovelessii]|nr:hypothetical protein E4U54_008122 [Claviceps lovelessii]